MVGPLARVVEEGGSDEISGPTTSFVHRTRTPSVEEIIQERQIAISQATGRIRTGSVMKGGRDEHGNQNVVQVRWQELGAFQGENREELTTVEANLAEEGRNEFDMFRSVQAACSRLTCVSDLSGIALAAEQYPVMSIATISTIGYACVGLLFCVLIGFSVDIVYLPGNPPYTWSSLAVGMLCSIPLLVSLDTMKQLGRCTAFLHRLFEAGIHLGFLFAIFFSASQTYNPPARFAMRTRVLDMIMDEYLLENQFPGTIAMAGEIGELYEWLEGPMASHFLCEDPPAGLDVGPHPDVTEMCFLPDGQFLADNLIELRQQRVRSELDYTLNYYSSDDRMVRVDGHGVRHGGPYSALDAVDEGPTWALVPCAACDASTQKPCLSNACTASPRGELPNLTIPYEQPRYRSALGVELSPIEHWGWYDRYHFGGFVTLSNSTKGKSDFIETVRQLHDAGWIDRYTRAIQVSTVLLNPATGFGAIVTALIETPQTGVIRSTPTVMVMQRVRESVRGVDVLNRYAFTLQACFFFYAMLTQFSHWFYRGTRWYFSHIGNAFDWVIIVFGLFILVDFVTIDYRSPDLSQSDYAQQILRAGYSLNYTMQRVSTMTGIQLWLLILRLLKFVPQLFGSRLHLFAHTVEKSAIDLIAFFATASCLLIAFTCIFHFTMGTYLREFATLGYSFFTVILGLSSVWDPTRWFEQDPVTSIILLSSFTAVCTWMLATMVIAIISEAFVAAKADIALQMRYKDAESSRKRALIEAWVHDPGEGSHVSSERLTDGSVSPTALLPSAAKQKLRMSFQKVRSVVGVLPPSGGPQLLSAAEASSDKHVPNAALREQPPVGGQEGAGCAERGANQSGDVSDTSPLGGRPPPLSLTSISTISRIKSHLKNIRSPHSDRSNSSENPSAGAPCGLMVKGCLWRGTNFARPDEPNASPRVRIVLQMHTNGSGKSARAGNSGRLPEISPGQSSQGTCEWGACDDFKSKAFNNKHSVEWNERFTLLAPIDMPDKARLIIALYDKAGALSQETLVAYTIVPLVSLVPKPTAADSDSAKSGGAAARAAKPIVYEYELRLAKAARHGLTSFFSRRDAQQSTHTPTLQLSLAVHKRKRPMRPGARPLLWKQQSRSPEERSSGGLSFPKESTEDKQTSAAPTPKCGQGLSAGGVELGPLDQSDKMHSECI